MKKKIIIFLLVLVLIASASLLSCTFLNDNEAGVNVANKNLPSVLELTCTFQASISYATGFIVTESGYVLTNAHVVTDSVDRFVYEAIEIKGKFYNSAQEYILKIIDYDTEKDMALLKFQRNDLTLRAVTTTNSEGLNYGATIYTLGNAEGQRLSMTKGIISVPKINVKDKETSILNEYIQIDAAVNNGSSGGPVMDINGDVIGMITFKIKKPGTFVEGIGFAIPSKVFLNYIKTITEGTPPQENGEELEETETITDTPSEEQGDSE